MAPGRPQLAALMLAASTALLAPLMGPSQNTGRSALGRAKGQPTLWRKCRFFISLSEREWLRNEHLPDDPLVASTMWPASHSRAIQSSTSFTPPTSTFVTSATDSVSSHCSMRSQRPCSTNEGGYDL